MAAASPLGAAVRQLGDRAQTRAVNGAHDSCLSGVGGVDAARAAGEVGLGPGVGGARGLGAHARAVGGADSLSLGQGGILDAAVGAVEAGLGPDRQAAGAELVGVARDGDVGAAADLVEVARIGADGLAFRGSGGRAADDGNRGGRERLANRVGPDQVLVVAAASALSAASCTSGRSACVLSIRNSPLPAPQDLP